MKCPNCNAVGITRGMVDPCVTCGGSGEVNAIVIDDQELHSEASRFARAYYNGILTHDEAPRELMRALLRAHEARLLTLCEQAIQEELDQLDQLQMESELE